MNQTETTTSDFFAALDCRDYKTLRVMLKQQPSLVNSHHRTGYTPMHLALKDGDKELALLLLTYGAKLYLGTSGSGTRTEEIASWNKQSRLWSRLKWWDAHRTLQMCYRLFSHALSFLPVVARHAFIRML